MALSLINFSAFDGFQLRLDDRKFIASAILSDVSTYGRVQTEMTPPGRVMVHDVTNGSSEQRLLFPSKMSRTGG
ncbi:hypothetical protein VNO77_12150 [Canavalia gladiata]|uniref:Uncharacterized protein n=1 Tax=Canavalia gladiata TaxID=3824 RepID=A0AAN9LVY5_CANGL